MDVNRRLGLFLALPLFYLAGVQSLEPQYRGPNIAVRGHPFTIECRLSAFDFPKWTKDGIPLSEDGDYELTEEGEDKYDVLLKLTVGQAEPEHSGEYRCNSFSRKSHRISLQDSDEDEDPGKEDKSVVLTVNKTIKIPCNLPINAAFPIFWFKNYVRILPGKDPDVIIRGNTLTIRNAQESDSGEYLCTYTDVKTMSKPAVSSPDDVIGHITTVKYPSRVEDFAHELSLMAGTDLKLECKVHGAPVPRVMWLIGNIPAALVDEAEDRLDLSANAAGLPDAVLTLTNLTFDDRNMYTCRAENSLNVDERSVFVTIRVLVTCDSDTLVHEGGKFTLTCHVPLSGVHLWFKDGVPILPTSVNRFHLEQEAPRRGGPHSSPADIYVASNQDHYIIMRLSVDKAALMHSGEYKCSSFSPHSRRIRVLTEGRVHTNANDTFGGVLLEKDKPLELQCNVTGDDGPNSVIYAIQWKKDGKELETEKGFSLTPENYTLRVDHPKEGEHTGNYTCIFTRGTEEPLVASIFVKTRAHVHPFSKSINLVQGDTLSLKCFYGGVPTPVIRWFKDDVPLNESDRRVNISYGEEDKTMRTYSLLKVVELDFDDRGDYKCEADNELNENPASTVILIRVKDKLAALWPFLGICVEVAILCTIIFVYEKKRVKPDFEESDADQNTDNKNVQDQKEGPQDVRQRK